MWDNGLTCAVTTCKNKGLLFPLPEGDECFYTCGNALKCNHAAHESCWKKQLGEQWDENALYICPKCVEGNCLTAA